MTSTITTVSMQVEDKEFLKEYKLSASTLLQESIWEMRGRLLKLTGDKIEKMSNLIEKQARRIEELENVLEKAANE